MKKIILLSLHFSLFHVHLESETPIPKERNTTWVKRYFTYKRNTRPRWRRTRPRWWNEGHDHDDEGHDHDDEGHDHDDEGHDHDDETHDHDERTSLFWRSCCSRICTRKFTNINLQSIWQSSIIFYFYSQTEIHVHGYDIHFMVYPDKENKLRIDLTIAGEFEIEDHWIRGWVC